MKNKIKNILRPIYRFFKLIWILNCYKTIYINFKTQSFQNAIKFPIFVYGKLKICSLKGRIIIDAPIETGMIHIGKDLDHNPVSLNPIKLNVCTNGKLIFKGRSLISGGSTVTVWSGEIVLGKNVTLGSGVQIKSVEKIVVGDFSRITALCTVMDTNVHYVKNTKTGEIKRSSAPIKIGSYCWINSGSSVTKGAVIPNYCITVRNTYLNKDYSVLCEANSMLAGTPAKVVASGVQRIFDFEEETRLNKYFNENKDTDVYKGDIGLFEEPDTIPSVLKIF